MTAQEIEERDKRTTTRLMMEALEEDLFIDPNEEIDHPPVCLSFGEHKIGAKVYPTPIATYGNLIMVQAPPKSMKTFFTSLLSAAYLADSVEGVTGKIKGHREGRCLYHFDTEQGKFHAQRVFRRVLDMTKMTNECYNTYGLRTLSYKDRIDFIEYCLYDKNEGEGVGLVVLDGIADLVSDVNDIEQTNLIVQRIMRWTQDLSCTVICIIHSNHNDASKATGHLGSFLEKKSETVIQLELLQESEVTVKCRRSRNFPFEQFSFKVNQYGIPSVIGCDFDFF